MSLELQATLWLKYEKRCPLVLLERSPRAYFTGQPDVMGITESRYLLEIEIKRTMSDFRANAKKPHVRNRMDGIPNFVEKAPKQFWFMMPPDLAEKAKPHIPDYAGLMTVKDPTPDNGHFTPMRVVVLKKSPVNDLSEKLSLKDCVRLIRNVGNQMIDVMHANHHRRAFPDIDCHAMDSFYQNRLNEHGFYEPNPDYLNFQI